MPYLYLIVPLIIVNDVGIRCENDEHGILEMMIRRLALSPFASDPCHLDKIVKYVSDN